MPGRLGKRDARWKRKEAHRAACRRRAAYAGQEAARAAAAAYCYCGHVRDEHRADGPCTVDGCDCPFFDEDHDAFDCVEV